MLKHEVNEWHDNGLQDLITVPRCIQIAINKMQLCLLSIASVWPYNKTTATMEHSVHSIDISKLLAPTRPYTWLDALPNSLKRCWKLLIAEKLTLNSLATSLVDVPAVSMTIARSLNFRPL